MYESDYFHAGEPTVNQQIVKTDDVGDGGAQHTDGVLDFGFEHLRFPHADVSTSSRLWQY